MLLNILNHFTSRRTICSLSAAATSRAQLNYSHLNYYDGSSTFVRVLVREQTNQTTQGRQKGNSKGEIQRGGQESRAYRKDENNSVTDCQAESKQGRKFHLFNKDLGLVSTA